MSPAAEAEIERVGSVIGDHMADIASLFKPGVKLTLLARCPDAADGTRDLVLTDDSLDAAIVALAIRRDQGANPPVTAARSAPAPEGVETLSDEPLEQWAARWSSVATDVAFAMQDRDPDTSALIARLANAIDRLLAAPRSGAGDPLEELLVAALDMAHARQWAMEWPDRYANLVLEASEFTEAWRGKHGDPVKEAGDVLLTYLLALGAAGVSWADAVAACAAKVAEFRTRPAYHGEFTAAHRAALPPRPTEDADGR